MPPFRSAVRSVVAVALLAGAVVAVPATARAATTDTLLQGQQLASGASLTSTDGRTRLVMQGDGNLVLYSPTRATWASRTAGRTGATFTLQTDGNLVVRDATGTARWASGTHDLTRLQVQSDGNLVGRDAAGVARWTTGTNYPPPSAGPFRSPSGRFVAAMQDDGNFVLRYYGSASPDALWTSGTAGHSRAYLTVQSDGNAVIRENGRAIWASGTAGHAGATLAALDTGALAVVAGGRTLWSSGTAGATAGLDGPSPDPRFTRTWTHVLGGVGSQVGSSSPGVGTFDAAGPSVVFGTHAPQLLAYHVSDGSGVAGFPASTGGIVVDSTPSVSGSGSTARIFVGLGTSASHTVGGYAAFGANGRELWLVRPNAIWGGGGTVGVMSSLPVGNLQTGNDVIGGAMGLTGYAISSTGGVLRGFPWYQGDTNFSTPALADINGDGRDEAIMGGDTSAGPAFGRMYANGGVIRIVKNTGTQGGSTPAQATSCERPTNQVVQSSPAVGRVFNGQVGIVVGTGPFWPNASDTNAVFALDLGCNVRWRTLMDGASIASPSLIDVDGNGSLEVVTASSHGDGGTLYVLDGATGRVRSATALPGRVSGQVVSIDIAGRRSLLVGTTSGVVVADAATGRLTGTLVSAVGVQNTPTVTVDPGGRIGVTVVGYNGARRGVALHYQLNGATATTVSGPGQWPMFHHDPRLRGSTL